ncbi:hypothetical protein [Scytonema millei]|uniref:Uncharacterized protein n=1 Tax=Scytonema millei VB511283 TaxID=1245923 RepID=A0A9X5EEI2_9CYAN|nr:hypothetical protein [Scytonema millei]NHC38127.1 hypothetical protein [Scytonema millei VB511283]
MWRGGDKGEGGDKGKFVSRNNLSLATRHSPLTSPIADNSGFQLDKTHDRRGARLCAPTDVMHAIENCYN